jgi:HSP20 family protein
MTLVRWDPLSEMQEMADRFNRHFGRPMLARPVEPGSEKLTVPDWAPAVDVAETPQEYLIDVELSEVGKDDVKVSVADGVLCIEGERRRSKQEKGTKYHRVERAYGRFFRRFALPDDVDEQGVRADFKEGVLRVHLPKSEKAKPRAIEVAAA